MTHSTRIRPGAKAFIVHEGKILLVKERVDRDGTTEIIYDVPGGGIEPGERLHEALKREVMEEVGLTVEIERPVGAWDFMLDNSTENVHIVCVGYQCRLVGSAEIDITKNPAQEEAIFDTVWMTKAEILAQPEILGNADMVASLENVVA